MVAKPPVKSMSAVATVVPSASFSWEVSVAPAGPSACPPPPSPGEAVGDGEPVQTDGVVPGVVAMGSFGLHALKATTGTAKKAEAATGFSMRKTLAGDRDYHARRLLGQLEDPRLDGRLE